MPFGVPQGFSPPEKLGKLRHTIDLMLYPKGDVSRSRIWAFIIGEPNRKITCTVEKALLINIHPYAKGCFPSAK